MPMRPWTGIWNPGTRRFGPNVQQPRWAKGTRLLAKVVRIGVLGLTGTLDCIAPIHDPLVDRDLRWYWRYDVRWDDRPAALVPVADVGPPFTQAIRTAREISREDFLRASRALHGHAPPRQ